MDQNLDGSVYPDQEPPEEFITEAQKADYLHRVIGAFDHGVVPDGPTLTLLSSWKEIFDRYPMNSSPAYAALRNVFGWEETERHPWLGEPTYMKFDRIEGRTDGFADAI